VVQGFPAKKVKDVYFSNVRIDVATSPLSFTNAENIVLSNVVIGGEATQPSTAK